MKRHILQLLLLASLSSVTAMGQINCVSGAAAQKLVCEFPFATGLFRNDSALGVGSGTSGATLNAQQLASSINIGIATQVSQLPLASASAGTVEVYKAGVPETFNNLGPILTDRAQTVGRHRLFLGFTASQFVFTDIDGTSLDTLPFSYAATALNPSTGAVLSTTYTTESTKLQFKIDQFIGVATYGVSNRIDVSVVVPTEYVSLGATTYNSQSYIVNANNVLVFGPYSNPQTYTSGTASGLGDITVNGKGELWTGEHATVSAAMNVRVPSGDDLNYLGSGAWGFNPYIIYSYLGKVSPHAKLGYQWNTSTELNNPTFTSGGNLSLPGGMQYDVGADWAVAKRLTVAADLLGNQFLNTPRLISTKTTITGLPTPLATSIAGNSTYSLNNASAGLKIAAYRDLVLSGNVLFQINDNGLRSRPTPLVGISYKF
ncbi:MAG TPA: hypothetical protein VFB43_01910 [Terracidiphilus sp.]|nr:hypothetical protein [Terracidiphilus sp.]